MIIDYYDDRPSTGYIEAYWSWIDCPKCGECSLMATCTTEEEKIFGCGRPGCCARAFVCTECKHRVALKADAPEMENSE